MSSHDFKGLHDKEFEVLCADLLRRMRTRMSGGVAGARG